MVTRREWLARAGALAGGALMPELVTGGLAKQGARVRVAAIFTAFTYRSHAHVILENFLKPYLFCGKLIEPRMQVVSMCGDQFPEGEMSRQVAREYNIRLAPTIREALTLGGN